MNEKATITTALDRLQTTTGIQAKWKQPDPKTDGELDLYWEGHGLHTYVEVKRELRRYHINALLGKAQRYQPLMVVAGNIFPDLKATLRDNKIGYLDTAGNIYLPTKDHLIWIEGNKPVKEERPVTNRAFTKTGLRTVFYLLINKDAINLPYRVLALETGVALGNINNIIGGLKDAGFILPLDEKKMILQNKKALLERWMAGYQETLKPALHIGNYHFWTDEHFFDRDYLQGIDETVWGGEPAAQVLTDYLTPEILTIYTARPVNILVTKWRLIPDEKGNVQVYKKFWTDEKWDARKLAPPLLAYADLMLTNDPRCTDAANVIYNEQLKHELE
ncbi:MAG TPA: type IV toxin-antitoxin system AbiEi family antitoxin [Puia sp.]|nr:type IV toxin-antitoxin system AbiEi family antitoxin [Puia sp.]